MRRRCALTRYGLPLLAAVALLGCRAAPDRPDIVLVVLDTLRRDFTGLGEVSYTPHLDRFAEGATVFSRARANGPWTVPSHASMFTGALPSVHGCTSRHPRFETGLPTLAELLEASGYRTAAFYSNPWLSDGITGLLRGFRDRLRAPIYGGAVEGGFEQGGPETAENLERWLDERSGSEPAFLFVNLLEAHAPYDPPPAVRTDLGLDRSDRVDAEWILDFQAGLHPPETVDWSRVRRLYGGDVFFADRVFGRILELLDDDAILIVTSDHGENLGEHGFVEHQLRLDETLLAVPLVVRAPGLPPGRNDRPVQLSDLFATVLGIAGIEAPIPLGSRSLLTDDDPGRPLIAEYAGAPPSLLRHLASRNPDLDTTSVALRSLRVGDLRWTVDSRGRGELHDLAADPDQELDVATARTGEASEMRDRLAEVFGNLTQAQTNGALALSDEDRERLRSLGYVP